jgi:hypothetical protein
MAGMRVAEQFAIYSGLTLGITPSVEEMRYALHPTLCAAMPYCVMGQCCE